VQHLTPQTYQPKKEGGIPGVQHLMPDPAAKPAALLLLKAQVGFIPIVALDLFP
jgi:hypothetical protein